MRSSLKRRPRPPYGELIQAVVVLPGSGVAEVARQCERVLIDETGELRNLLGCAIRPSHWFGRMVIFVSVAIRNPGSRWKNIFRRIWCRRRRVSIEQKQNWLRPAANTCVGLDAANVNVMMAIT